MREVRELKLVVEGKAEFWDDAGKTFPNDSVVAADEQDDTIPQDCIPRPSTWPMPNHF